MRSSLLVEPSTKIHGLPRHVSLLFISYLISLAYAVDGTWVSLNLLVDDISRRLYWDAQNKDFQMCPAPYPSVVPSPTPTMLAATAAVTAAAVAGTAATSRAPSPTSTGTDLYSAAYNCSNSIRTLSDLLPYIASYMSDTSSRSAANVVFLVLNLHDLGIIPTAGAAATIKTLSSTLLATIGNSSIYTPQVLVKHRSSVNETWRFVSPYYVTSSSDNITLLVAFGTNTI
ncbi:hypothetical protein SeLEV6574_g07210 [Synchytrium endobioticum]|uniref:MTC6 partial TIM-barrel domain-containing protein n=1 Tax=Synchytrium endobioticum TaxID=286115 RepID=A0A507CIF6_9FUNG|nr:hypothetical protein SeLEV6574_g07210 [Synchytrium endobioticum]